MSQPTLTYRTRGGDVTNAAGLGVVFLSYRKKNVIYRNDVARDILERLRRVVRPQPHSRRGLQRGDRRGA